MWPGTFKLSYCNVNAIYLADTLIVIGLGCIFSISNFRKNFGISHDLFQLLKYMIRPNKQVASLQGRTVATARITDEHGWFNRICQVDPFNRSKCFLDSRKSALPTASRSVQHVYDCTGTKVNITPVTTRYRFQCGLVEVCTTECPQVLTSCRKEEFILTTPDCLEVDVIWQRHSCTCCRRVRTSMQLVTESEWPDRTGWEMKNHTTTGELVPMDSIDGKHNSHGPSFSCPSFHWSLCIGLYGEDEKTDR